MRQTVIVAPLLFLLFFILYFFTPDFTFKIMPESFIDEDALVMITQKDLEKRINELTMSPLGKAVSGMDLQDIADELAVPSIDGANIVAIKESVGRAMKDPLLKILFGREVTLALSPFKLDGSAAIEQQLADNLLLIGRPKHPAKLIDLLTNLVPQKELITEARYGGHIIKRFPFNDKQTISAARVKGLIVFSVNEKLLRRGLDRYDNGGAKSLEQQVGFQTTKRTFSKASLFGYVNIFRIHQSVSRAINAISPEEGSRLTDELEKYEGYTSGYFGAWKQKNQIIEKGIINFNRELMSDTSLKRLTAVPGKAGTISRIGDDSLLYYWNSQLDLDPLLEIVTMLGGQDGGEYYGDIVKQISSITGLDPKDIEDLADNDMTLVIKGIPQQQFVPIPYFMFMIKVDNQKKMRSAVTRLIEHYSIPVRSIRIQGADAFTWGGVIGVGSLQPTLAFVGDYLVVASNQEQIEEFTVFPEAKTRLNQAPLFKSVDNGLSGENNSIVFMNFSKITAMFKELVSWGGTMIAIKDRDVARKSKLLIDRVINPMLDGIAMYSVIGMRKYVKDDNIIFESTTVVDYGKE